jgi:hypothetical protein
MTLDDIRGASPIGTVARLENRLGDLSDRREQAANQATAAESEAASARQLVDTPFPDVARIAWLRRRLAEIDTALVPPPEDAPVRVEASPTAKAALDAVGPRVTNAPPAMRAQALVRAGQELGGYVAAAHLDADDAAAALKTVGSKVGLDPGVAIAAMHAPRPASPPSIGTPPCAPSPDHPGPARAGPVVSR